MTDDYPIHTDEPTGWQFRATPDGWQSRFRSGFSWSNLANDGMYAAAMRAFGHTLPDPPVPTVTLSDGTVLEKRERREGDASNMDGTYWRNANGGAGVVGTATTLGRALDELAERQAADE